MNDLALARKFVGKADNARNAGIHFDLSFTAFKNIYRAKRCQLTGILLTDRSGPSSKGTDRTIDRIDAKKGYIKGNVMAVCSTANTFKANFENGNRTLELKHAEKIIKFMQKNNL